MMRFGTIYSDSDQLKVQSLKLKVGTETNNFAF